LIRQRFEKSAARAGLARGGVTLRSDLFAPPGAGAQLDLF
jgi:hypothetical protein